MSYLDFDCKNCGRHRVENIDGKQICEKCGWNQITNLYEPSTQDNYKVDIWKDIEMKIDSRQSDEKDDTPVLITRGLLKQLLHQMFNRTVEVPFIEEGKVIEGLLINADNKFEIGYTDGTMSECDTWAEIIE